MLELSVGVGEFQNDVDGLGRPSLRSEGQGSGWGIEASGRPFWDPEGYEPGDIPGRLVVENGRMYIQT